MNSKESSGNSSLDKALKLLDYFTAQTPVWGLSELSRASNIPKATVYRIVSSFEQNGFLKRIDIMGKQNQYTLGIKFLTLGTLAADTIEIKEIALPFMAELRDLLNEDVQLVLRDGDQAVYVEKLMCSHPVRLYTKTGRTAGLYAGACPRAILSFLPDEEIERILTNTSMAQYTTQTPSTKEMLWDTILQSRHLGYTISYGELEPDTAAVGAPIYDHTQTVVAAISTAGPVNRFGPDALVRIIEQTIKTALMLSKALGYSGN